MNTLATTQATMPESLDDAISTLKASLFPTTLQEALSLLHEYSYQYTAVKVARDMRPEKLEEHLAEHSYPEDYTGVCRLIHDVLFPLDDCCELQESEWGESRCLVHEAITPLGDMGWDDWEEMMEEMSEQPMSTSLIVFLRFLHINECEERWKAANKHFGWKIPYPKMLKKEANFKQYEFNNEKYETDLRDAGLGVFIRAYEFVNFYTGNDFLDYNTYDVAEGVLEPTYFSEETLRELTKAYEESQAWIDDYETAWRMVNANPAVLKKYNKIFWGAFERKTPQPQTLAEIFAGEEIEETQCQTLMTL